MSEATHPLIGQDLGNYTVKRILGQGGMGAVFAGTHKFLGNPVAIKVLHGSYSHDPGITQRFFQEAKSSIEIGHPGIIKILDFGQTADGALYLVMELLDGLSLGDAITAANGFEEPELVRLATQMCDALEAAHALGIVHRDLKPDNIFILRNGDVKILDFGIAKVASSGNSTKTGSLMGTPSYMAPEQCRDSKLVGPHSDIYALGVILFEMATARRPFDGELAEVLAKHLFEAPPAASSVRPGVSPELERLILQCMEKKPEDRPPGMGNLRSRLQSLSTQQMEPGTAARALATARAKAKPEAPKTRSRAPLYGSVAAAVLVGGGLVAWRMSARPMTPEVPVAAVASPPAMAPPPPAAATPTAVEPSPEPAPASKKLVIRTDPSGARVSIGGKDRGPSPLIIEEAIPVEVTLTLPGFKQSHEVITTQGESIFHLTADRHHDHTKPAVTAQPTTKSTTKPTASSREGLE